MAKVTHRFKACHLEVTQEEWQSLSEVMDSEEYTFPEYFAHPSNDSKALPEHIVDLVELRDFIGGMGTARNVVEVDRHLTAVAQCLNMEVRELSDLGLLQIYFEEE